MSKKTLAAIAKREAKREAVAAATQTSQAVKDKDLKVTVKVEPSTTVTTEAPKA